MRSYFEQDKNSQILIKLGLSSPQAKIYCALAGMQEGTNAAISKIANMARQQVYREMPRLSELGLVEKIIATPSKYRATPISTCVEILTNFKTLEFAELQKETKHFLKTQKNKPLLILEEPSQFLIAKEKTVIFKRYAKEIESSKIAIEIIGPAYANEEALLNQIFETKLEQGVKFRIITEKLRKSNEIQNALNRLQNNPLFEIRELPDKPPVQLAIHDRKRVDIIVPESSLLNIAMPPDLWTNNISIVTLAITYFEEMWSRAKELNIKYVEFADPKSRRRWVCQ